jgi:hypothetical protein
VTIVSGASSSSAASAAHHDDAQETTQREPARPSSAAGAVLLTAAAAVPLLVASIAAVQIRGQIVAGSLAVALLSGAALVLVNGLPGNRNALSRWRAGPWYVLWFAFAFGIATLTWIEPPTGTSLSQISLGNIVWALVICAVALATWTVGYLLGPPAHLVRLLGRGLSRVYRGTVPTPAGGGLLWLLYGLGTAARLATAVLSGGFGYVGDPSVLVTSATGYANVLSMVSTFATFAVASAAYRYFDSRGTECRWTLCLLLVLELGVAAVGGTKAAFITTVLAVLIPYGALRGRLPRKAVLASVALFLLVVIPFNLAYRQTVRNTQNLSPTEAAQVAPDLLGKTVTTEFRGEDLLASGTYLLHRIRLIENVAIVHQKTPVMVPYRNTLDLLAAPVVGVIPRAIWPDKPIMATGYEFNQEYYGLSAAIYSSAAITPQGDLYRYGGWPVLLAGMLLLGLGYRLVDVLFRPEVDPRSMFFLLVFLPDLIRSETDAFTMAASIPSGVLTAVLGIWIGFRRIRRRPLPA